MCFELLQQWRERERKNEPFCWRKEEGYKYPSPIIEPLEAIFCVRREASLAGSEAGSEAGLESSRAGKPALTPA